MHLSLHLYTYIITIVASPIVIRRRKEINIDILLKHELFPRSFNPCHSSFAHRLCTAHIIAKMILFYMNSSEHIFTSAICSTSRIRQRQRPKFKNFNKSRCHINQHSRAECIFAKYMLLSLPLRAQCNSQSCTWWKITIIPNIFETVKTILFHMPCVCTMFVYNIALAMHL